MFERNALSTSGSGAVVGYEGCANKAMGSRKDGEFLDQLNTVNF
jgi:hypothetical protein